MKAALGHLVERLGTEVTWAEFKATKDTDKDIRRVYGWNVQTVNARFVCFPRGWRTWLAKTWWAIPTILFAHQRMYVCCPYPGCVLGLGLKPTIWWM